jgi:hypothetical protein
MLFVILFVMLFVVVTLLLLLFNSDVHIIHHFINGFYGIVVSICISCNLILILPILIWRLSTPVRCSPEEHQNRTFRACTLTVYVYNIYRIFYTQTFFERPVSTAEFIVLWNFYYDSINFYRMCMFYAYIAFIFFSFIIYIL